MKTIMKIIVLNRRETMFNQTFQKQSINKASMNNENNQEVKTMNTASIENVNIKENSMNNASIKNVNIKENSMNNASIFFNYITSKDEPQGIFKIGNTDFYRGRVNASGTGYEFQRYVKNRKRDDGARMGTGDWLTYDEFAEIARKQDGGVFFGCRDGLARGATKDFQKDGDVIIAEIDDLPIDEQLQKFKVFEEVTGLKPTLIHSGGKSIHAQLFTYKTDIEEVMYLNQLFIIGLDSDPALGNRHQPFRAPTFFRKEKGNYQELLQQGEVYSRLDILFGMERWFDYIDLKMPTEIGDVYWQEIKQVLNSDKINAARKAAPIAKAEKREKLAVILEKGNKVVKKEKQRREKRREAYKAQFGENTSIEDKESLINEVVSLIPQREKGTGTYEMYRSIGCAIKNLMGQTRAVDLMNQLAPTGENWDMLLGSSTGDFGLGTIIHYGKLFGFEFRPTDKIHAQVVLEGEAAIKEARRRVKNSEFLSSVIAKKEREMKKGFCNPHTQFSYGDCRLKTVKFEEIKDNFPTPSEVDELPKIKFKSEDRAKVINAARKAGWKNIFDGSCVGSGKSHAVPQLDGVLYVDVNFKNPSIDKVEEMPKLPTRCQDGLFKTEEGMIKADVKDAEAKGLEQVEKGNCIHAKATVILHSKNQKFEIDEVGSNALCGVCSKKAICSKNFDLFKYKRRTAIADITSKNQGRVHFKQLSNDLFGKGGAFKDMTLVWEEAGLVPTTKEVSFDTTELYDLLKHILPISQTFGMNLITFNQELDRFVKECKKDKEMKRYGIDAVTFNEFLNRPEIKELMEITEQEKQAIIDFYEAAPKFPTTDIEPLDDHTSHQKEIYEFVEQLPPHWGLPFFKILTAEGYEHGLVNIVGNTVTLIIPDSHAQDLAKNSKCNVFLDATETSEDIKRKFNLTEPILTICQEMSPSQYENLDVVKIPMSGLGSIDMTDSTQDRVKMVMKAIQDKHEGNVAFITHMRHKEALNTQFHFGKDDRGTNALKDYPAIAAIGSPNPNVLNVQNEWLLVNGSMEGFEKYYDAQVIKQQVQYVGRARSQHTDEKRTVYLIGSQKHVDEVGKKFFKQVSTLSLLELCPEAIDDQSKYELDLLGAVLSLLMDNVQDNKSASVTITAIAEKMGRTRQSVSRHLNNPNNMGVKELVKLAESLIKQAKERPDHASDIDGGLLHYLSQQGDERLLDLARKMTSKEPHEVQAFYDRFGASHDTVLCSLWYYAKAFNERTQEICREFLKCYIEYQEKL